MKLTPKPPEHLRPRPRTRQPDFRIACVWCGGMGQDKALSYAEPPHICTCPIGANE